MLVEDLSIWNLIWNLIVSFWCEFVSTPFKNLWERLYEELSSEKSLRMSAFSYYLVWICAICFPPLVVLFCSLIFIRWTFRSKEARAALLSDYKPTGVVKLSDKNACPNMIIPKIPWAIAIVCWLPVRIIGLVCPKWLYATNANSFLAYLICLPRRFMAGVLYSAMYFELGSNPEFLQREGIKQLEADEYLMLADSVQCSDYTDVTRPPGYFAEEYLSRRVTVNSSRVLNIESANILKSNATEDEIKRSFKRLALKWHPDKNPDRAEECTAFFVLIQQAYEVLMDPQERAFYDRHRENIIHKQASGDGPDERRDTGIRLEGFMSTSCFRGIFSSEEERQENFYSVYRDLFHKLAAEDYEYIEDPEERNYPVFGKATSDYDTVVAPFYGFWLDFSTQRSFAWLDKWDLREAPDRPSARAMEKENRKLRELGRKQRSEDVRKLVEFVRKHDRRVEAAKERMREQAAQAQQRVEEQRRSQIRRNLENLEVYELDDEAHRQHLAHLDEIEQQLDAQFGIVETRDENTDEEDSNEDEDSAQLRCIVCEKNFKNRKVLENHQKSKKHKQMLELLRAHMREEDKELFEREGGSGKNDEEEEEGLQQRGGRRKKKKGKKTREEEGPQTGNEEQENSKPVEGEAASDETAMEEAQVPKREEKSTKKQKKRAEEKPTAAATKPEVGSGGPKSAVPSECLTCGLEFESKTRLHVHLKESGHAALKGVLGQGAGAKKAKAKKGNK